MASRAANTPLFASYGAPRLGAMAYYSVIVASTIELMIMRRQQRRDFKAVISRKREFLALKWASYMF